VRSIVALNEPDLRFAFAAPQTEEGQEIAQSAIPHEHPAYWSYILRCVLRGFHTSAASLLTSLSNTHPSPTLQKVAHRASHLLSSMPRSTAFGLEHDFISAHRKWLAQIRSLLSGLEREMDEMERELDTASSKGQEELEDERLELEAQFRCLLEVMAGVQERVFEACDDWREALGAWGLLIQPALKRDDVPETIQIVLESFPIDTTLPHEGILAALAQGEVVKACQLAENYDPWLAAHMTDLLDRVGVLDDQEVIEGKQAASLRLKYLEQYAETVMDDQGLWRLAVDYLSYCGPTARHRMRSIILDVPISGPDALPSRAEAKRAEQIEVEAEEAAMDEEADDPEKAAEERQQRKEAERAARRVSEEFNTVLELLQTCVDLHMDMEARALCKKMAMQMTSEKKYGPAIAYCVRANDVRQMKRIADLVLLQYIEGGVEPFCLAVDSIPSSLLQASAHEAQADQLAAMEAEAGLPDTFSKVVLGSTPNLTSSRLAFLARYRDFHREYAAGNLSLAATLLVEILSSGVAPENFWAVLLIDAVPLLQDIEQDYFTKEQAYELLRVLDHVTTSSSIHTLQALHFLGLLEQLLAGPTKAKKIQMLYGEEQVAQDWRNSAAAFDARAATTRLDILRLSLARRLARMSS
jgi:nuclear pore complex protein Nup85